MSNFLMMKQAIQDQMQMMEPYGLFIADATKDELWDTYLSAFPPGADPMFRKRTTHNCQCCKQFIRACGHVVTIIDGRMVSIWDVMVPDIIYSGVAKQMSEMVKSKSIRSKFLHYENRLGTNQSREPDIVWDHFHYVLDSEYVAEKENIATSMGKHRSNVQVFHRALSEFTVEALDIVLDLIAQNTLYRGDQYRLGLQQFTLAKAKFESLDMEGKELYAWSAKVPDSVRGIRSSAIGSLLDDLSKGRDLDASVGSFEAKVAPSNYKRPKALITQGMIKKAEEKVSELGILDALPRRFAVKEDLTINNVLFANVDSRKAMGAFDQLRENVPVDLKRLDRVEEVSIDTFIKDILPTATKLEMMLENGLESNMVALIAPVNPLAQSILQWDNNFTWTYNGEVADSMKERVRAKGGDVEGDLRFSIQWNEKNDNHSDLDAHCKEPRNHIHFPLKGRRQQSSGMLDVDIISPGRNVAVENITYSDRSQMPDGKYEFLVHCYGQMSASTGFTAEVEFDGQLHSFTYPQVLGQGQKIPVADIICKNGNFTIEPRLESSMAVKDVWGLSTQNWQNVSMLMLSPNHWDGQTKGNKHWFFMLEGAKHAGSARGFYNEFLRPELTEHRKVFEVLGSKMRVEPSDEQLCGLGFSSTIKASVLCKVEGSFNRVVKINF